MKDFYYILPIFIVAVVSFFGGFKFEKPKIYRRGWNDGASSAVEWLAVALMKMGWQGKELENLLNQIAENLKEIKDGQTEDPGANEKGGVK